MFKNSVVLFLCHQCLQQLLGILFAESILDQHLKLFFNRDLNRGFLVYMISLRFSGSKFLINLRRQFRVSKIFSCTENFLCTSFCGICSLCILCLKLLYRKCATYLVGCSFIKTSSLTGCWQAFFFLVNRVVFSRSNDLITHCLIACLMN